MKSLTLFRVVDNLWGTFGILVDGNDFMCATIERNWADNKPNVSCIRPAPGEPPARYMCRRGHWPSHGDAYEIADVPGRSAILIHRGNFETDSKGCLVLGSGFARINGQQAISASGEAYNNFLAHMKGDNEFELTIKWAS